MNETERLTLLSLLTQQTVAALATLHRDEPAVSMVPFALLPDKTGLVIHVSQLASHTRDMLAHPKVGLLITGSAADAQSSLALPRVMLKAQTRQLIPEDALYPQARASYLSRFPEAEELFSFADFSLFEIEPTSIRYVAGFGSARTLNVEQLNAILNR